MVKFLKNYPVERLWNAGRNFHLLDVSQKHFQRAGSLSIVAEPLRP
jgi:hypothetical protein